MSGRLHSMPLFWIFLTSSLAFGGDIIYHGSDVWDAVIEIDVPTGNRTEILLADYPRIIKAADFAVNDAGDIYIETFDAIQRVGIYSVSAGTLERRPVSGGVDGFSPDLLGSGPPFSSHLRTIIHGESSLFVLMDLGGIFEVDIVSGGRRIVTPADAPASRDNSIPMFQPDDMVQMRDGSLLVADRFEGLVRVDMETGVRSRLPDEVAPSFTPRRMDMLTQDVLVYSGLDFDVAAVWALNLSTGREWLVSGSFGGHEAGSGPPMASIQDIAVDGQGRLWVYDSITPALFAITPDGTRTIVSSLEVGSGPFFAFSDKPHLGTYARRNSAHGTAWSLH